MVPYPFHASPLLGKKLRSFMILGTTISPDVLSRALE